MGSGPGAKAALAEIYNAEDREHALKAAKAFAELHVEVLGDLGDRLGQGEDC